MPSPATPPIPLARVATFCSPELGSGLAGIGLSTLEALTARGLGDAVTDHRSSWVRKVGLGSTEVFVKTYLYATLAERMRGILRTTLWARSRPARERAALEWLLAHGFPAPRPLGVFEKRRHGLLEVAVLVTEAWPGTDLARLLPLLSADERPRCLAALDALVARLHASGFRDGNLDLRNVLARREPDGAWVLAKIDSPRFRIVRPGACSDRRARADRARLSRSLAEVDDRGRTPVIRRV